MRGAPGVALLLLALSAPLAVQAQGIAVVQPKPPTVVSFSPLQGVQGATATLDIRGSNFAAGAAVLFVPPDGLQVQKVTVVSSRQIRAEIKIAPGAPTGARELYVRVGQAQAKAPQGFTVTPAPKGIALQATVTNPPTIVSFSPLQGMQGATATLDIHGTNFAAGATVNFVPPDGLEVLSVTFVSSSQLRAQVEIATDAPLGVRELYVVVGQYQAEAPQGFTIVPMSAPPPRPVLPPVVKVVPPPPLPQVLKVTPNQVAVGSQNVELKLEGKNFAPGAQVSFSGVAIFAVGASEFTNDTELHVKINVLPSAQMGGRDITVKNPNNLAGTGKGMLNITAAKIAPPPTAKKPAAGLPVPKLPPITAATFFVKGKIYLTDPKWGLVGQSGEIKVDKGVPLLDDDLVFKWKEQNPGTADYFEIRFYAKGNDTPVLRKRLDPTEVQLFGKSFAVLSTYFRPNAAFLTLLLSKLPPPGKAGGKKAVAKAMPPPGGGGKGAAQPQGTQLSEGDLFWEVAGFRIFSESGVKSGSASASAKAQPVMEAAKAGGGAETPEPTTELEVEISDRWPLGRPDSPTGMACAEGGMTKSGLQVSNVSDKSIIDPKTGEPMIDPATGEPKFGINNYAGDTFVLWGNFSLAKSPYATHPEEIKAPAQPGQQLALNVEQYNFDNVFVDWGDGTTEPLQAAPAGGQALMGFGRGQQLSLPLSKDDPLRLSHEYLSTGNFTIRVFQVAEADLQQINPASLATAVDGPKGNYFQVMMLMTSGQARGGAQGLPVAPRASGPSPLDIANRAYMIYCYTLNITNREDLAASGPLHLVSVEITEFPGHEPPGAAAVKPGVKGPVMAPKGAGAAAPKAGAAAQVALPAVQAPAGQAAAGPAMKVAPGAALAQAVAGTQDIAKASTCDESLQAKAVLHYYGRGKARVTWKLDGVTVGSPEEAAGLSSEPRPGLGPDPSTWGPPKVSDWWLTSPFLNCQALGQHQVTVEAEVIPEPAAPNLALAVELVVNTAGKTDKTPGEMALASAIFGSLGKNPLTVGFISPAKESPPGMAPAAYLDAKASPALAGLMVAITVKGPPLYVVSDPKPYHVVESDPNRPCTFIFASNGGDFRVTDLQGAGNLTKNGTQYSGQGVLQFALTDGPESAHPYAVPVNFQNWDVPDGLHIVSAALSVSPGTEIAAPGVKGTLAQIAGKLEGGTKYDMETTLNLTLKDQSLRLPGAVEKPHEWKNAKAPVTVEGDWYLAGQTLPETLMGWSRFEIESNDVRLDLSRTEGEAAGSLCGPGSGAAWVGVHLGNATLVPYTMDLVGAGSLNSPVTDWGIVDSGLCGQVTTGPFNAKLGEGSIHLDSIEAKAQNGDFTATYKGMKVHVPWLDTDLTGDAKLQSGGGQEASISFPLAGTAPLKNYGSFTMKAGNLAFVREENIDWAVKTDTHFDMKAENKPFASFDANGLFFGMDGRAYFAKGKTSADVGLGGKSTLGETPLDLVSVHLTAPGTGADRLRFAIKTQAHLSEVMPASEMQVNYAISKPGASYEGSGPWNSPFTVNVAFPAGQPTVETAINPVYGTGSGTRYSGVVDLAMFGGPPVKAEFLLGYQGGHDYWITRATFDLGESGVTLVPPVMNLYAIRGGLGHNFALDSFQSLAPITNLTPKIDGSFLFMAGMRVGMPDAFTYMLDGTFTVKVGGADPGARMDFHAWILKKEHTGEGDFQGYFQYTPGNFDGELWGKLNLLGDAVYVEAPKGATKMHFGEGPWYIWFGRKEGPRIKGHVIVADVDSYTMIGSEGFFIGGGANYKPTAGDCDDACAYLHAYTEMGLGITLSPLHISGDYKAGVSAGGCVEGICADAGVNASVHAAALPPELRFKYSVGFICPVDDVSFTLTVLPGLGFNSSIDWCDFGIF